MTTPEPEPLDPSQRDALEELMTPLFELESGELPAEVERLCRSYPEHAAELRRRLQAVRLLLDNQAMASSASFPERLGDFRLIERLGGGGMGVVYRAEQLSLGREVALKLIRPEQLYFAGSRERFRRETEVVAKLQHPGIVSIHTVGEDKGVPYFAMELLPGRTLSEVLLSLSGMAPESLTAEDLFEEPRSPIGGGWVEACCELTEGLALALAHAHGRGVVHRDVKPSNAMLLPNGTSMLLDFGLTSPPQEELAQANHRVTRSGSQIGTLAYMSPEQVAGAKLDARTDIYSLGATLFELLTLRVPFSAESALELQQQILAGEPDSIRARNPRVSRDLETVCLKAMALRLSDRYGRAEDFARDLRNVIERRPIEAHPPGPVKRALRWTQRRPALAAAFALAGFLVVGLPSGLYLQQRAFNRDLTNLIELEKRARALGEAERVASVAVTDFMEQLFEYASPARSLGEDVSVAVLLQQGALRIERELDDQPLVRARLLKAIGAAYSWLGTNHKAEDFLQKALALQLEHKGPMDVTALQWRMEYARVLSALGKYPEAHELLSEVLEQEPPEDELAAMAFARCRSSYGVIKGRLGQPVAAEANLRAGLEVLESITAGEHLAAATSQEDYALFLNEMGRYGEALPLFEACLAKKRRVLKPGHPVFVNTELHLAQCLIRLGEIERARQHAESALAEAERIHGRQHPQYAGALLVRANLLRLQGQRAAGLEEQRLALGILQEIVGEVNPQLAWTLNDHGMSLMTDGFVDQAVLHLQRALEIHRKLHSEDHRRLATSLINLAEARAAQGELADARDLAEEGARMQRRLLGPGPILASSLGVLGSCLAFLGLHEEAEEVLGEAQGMLDGAPLQAALRESLHATRALAANLGRQPRTGEIEARAALGEREVDSLQRARAHYLLAWALDMQGRGREALPELGESIDMFGRLYPDGHPDCAYTLNQLGVSLLREDTEEALLALEEALELRRRFKVNPHWLSISLSNLAAAHFTGRDYAAALPFAEEAAELRRKRFSSPDLDLANTLFLIASAKASLGQVDGAVAAARDCLAEQRELYPAEHPIPARTASLLGEQYLRLERYAEAEPLLLEAYDILGKSRAEAGNLRIARQRLIELYHATGRPEAAQALKP